MQNKILISELVLAEHASADEVENLIENKINISYEEHRNTVNTMDTSNIVSKFIPFNGSTGATTQN